MQTKNDSGSSTKAEPKSTLGPVGNAIVSTASFAAGVVRQTEELIRDFASHVTKETELGPNPGATDLLVHQHRLVEALFERLESPKKGFDQTLRELADQLTAHILIEEQLFYPAVQKANPDVILEGLEEHAMGRFALQRLLGTQASDQSIKARLKALKELMETHHREEERELFPAVRKLMPDSALQKLGAKMQALFDASVKRGHEAVLATFDDTLRKPVRAKTVARGAKAARPRNKTAQHSPKSAPRSPKPAPRSPKPAPRSPKPAPRSPKPAPRTAKTAQKTQPGSKRARPSA